MICALLTSIAIVREKESGTLEQILTTPVRPAQVIIGKILPYMLVAMLDAALVIVHRRPRLPRADGRLVAGARRLQHALPRSSPSASAC